MGGRGPNLLFWRAFASALDQRKAKLALNTKSKPRVHANNGFQKRIQGGGSGALPFSHIFWAEFEEKELKSVGKDGKIG